MVSTTVYILELCIPLPTGYVNRAYLRKKGKPPRLFGVEPPNMSGPR
jgi:hypothetical protein